MTSEDTSNLIARLKATWGDQGQSTLLSSAVSLLESRPNESAVSGDVASSLLTEVVKPLFASTPNPNLTPAGRKNLVSTPPTTGRFNSPLLEVERKPWKQASWSIDILRYIVAQYDLQEASSRQAVVEKQFYFLVPPILTLIDDGDISYKATGCELLRALCDNISACKSTILLRSGLADVFADSLKANFMLLPTLTPENESLTLLHQLYPAFRALVSATYPLEEQSTPIKNSYAQQTPSQSSMTGDEFSYSHRSPRQQMLDMILRHGILASYNHASDHVAIATFLLHQAALIITDMRINAVKHLSGLLPLLRSVLTNPLGAAYPPLLEAAGELLIMLIIHGKPRIASTWWAECLRICVGCWLIVRTDLPESSQIRAELVTVVQKLREVVGDEKLHEVADMLLNEDRELKDLLCPG